jgi:alkylation response protein AidB-like acyl-CoA dehydrogenase
MATTSLPRAASRGGSFLVESCTPEDVFSPAELTDDQKLIGQTAEEFIRNEVVPPFPISNSTNPACCRNCLKKAGEIGLLGGGVPEEYGGAGLDKVSSVRLAEKLSAYASFGVSHGGHSGIGTLPIVFFGTEEQKKKYLPAAGHGREAGRVLPVGTAGGIGRAEFAHARRALARRKRRGF